MLFLSKRHIFIAETFTAGNFINSLILNNDNDSCSINGLISNNIFTLAKSLNISREMYIDNDINVKFISEITSKIYDKNKCDLLVCLLGKYSKQSYYNTGYIAIADEDGIHIYKNSVTGNQQDMVDVLSKSAAFYLIKKIKENNLLF